MADQTSPKIPMVFVYVGQRELRGQTALLHSYMNRETKETTLFKKKLSPLHRIGQMWTLMVSDPPDEQGNRYFQNSNDPKQMVGMWPDAAEVLSWELLEETAQTNRRAKSDGAKEHRDTFERALRPVKTAYTKLNRAEKAAMIASLIRWLEE